MKVQTNSLPSWAGPILVLHMGYFSENIPKIWIPNQRLKKEKIKGNTPKANAKLKEKGEIKNHYLMGIVTAILQQSRKKTQHACWIKFTQYGGFLNT